ncbi:tetratricopeptide repeat protein [Streptomyces sp. PRKS01-65]|nr:tetratricopeptide repeat protein [Streptomyces harenosi]
MDVRTRPCPGAGGRRTPRTRGIGVPGRGRPCEGVPVSERTDQSWEDRVAAAWAAFGTCGEERAAKFRAVIDALAGELPPDHPLGLFERACAQDSTGRPEQAVALYRRALDQGLSDVSGYRGRRAKIQLASSLRNVGRPQEGVELLTPELDAPSDELDDAVRATLALCLSSLGRDREGLSLVLGALAGHLPRYQRSMANYARLLVEPEPAGRPAAR